MFLILVADDAECSCLSPGFRLADCVIRKTELTLGFGQPCGRPNILSNFSLARRTRAFCVVARLFCVRAEALTRMTTYAAAHVPLPEITMSNSARQTIFASKFNGNTTSSATAAKQRGRGL